MPRGKCKECGITYTNKGLFIAGYCKHCAAKHIRAADEEIARLKRDVDMFEEMAQRPANYDPETD